MRCIAPAAVHAFGCLHKSPMPWPAGCQRMSRVPVHQWEPRALDLHHDPVPRPERMADVRNRELDHIGRPWDERLGLREAFSELAAEWLAANQLLVSAHTDARGVGVRIRIVAR